MIDIRIPCAIALTLAVTVACSESGAGGYEPGAAEAGSTPDEIQPAEVQTAIEQALDKADAEITPANAEDELRKLEGEIDGGG